MCIWVFIGERYGWVLEDFQDELKSLYPWISEYKGRSVTELEIRHAVLNHAHGPLGLEGKTEEVSELRKRVAATVVNSRFYFRDPSHTETLPELLRVDFAPENDYARHRMALLKKDIRV